MSSIVTKIGRDQGDKLESQLEEARRSVLLLSERLEQLRQKEQQQQQLLNTATAADADTATAAARYHK